MGPYEFGGGGDTGLRPPGIDGVTTFQPGGASAEIAADVDKSVAMIIAAIAHDRFLILYVMTVPFRIVGFAD